MNITVNPPIETSENLFLENYQCISNIEGKYRSIIPNVFIIYFYRFS